MQRPTELVLSEYTFPFKLRKHQQKAIDSSTNYHHLLIGDGVGYGKTALGTGIALHDSLANGSEQLLILAPPILLNQWCTWVGQIPELRGLANLYRGTPKQRQAMKMEEPIQIMSYNIFRSDIKKITKFVNKARTVILADELSLKDTRTQTHRFLRKLLYGVMRPESGSAANHRLIALNGTPINKREDIYPWCSMMVPSVYRSQTVFLNLHAETQDNYGKVLRWKDEDLMDNNFNLFYYRSPEDSIELPPLTITPILLELSPKHRRAYNALAEMLIQDLPDKVTELAAKSMFTTLQRLITTPHLLDIDVKPPLYEWLESYMDQVGEERFICFTARTLTIKGLIDFFGEARAGAIYGEVAQNARDIVFSDFEEKRKQVLLMNLQAGGKGLNLQYARRVVFAEVPSTGDLFRQAYGRVFRSGQDRQCFVDVPIAADTVQDRIYHQMLQRDEDVQSTTWTKQSLKDIIFG